MYDFKDITAGPVVTDISSVAVSIDDNKLDLVIPHYRTLNVLGRDLIGRSLSTIEDVPGRDGIIVVGQTLPARTLTIEYKIEAPSNEEMRRSFDMLNQELFRRTGEVYKIHFDDDPGYYFEGYLGQAPDPPSDTNSIYGTFTLLCPTPWKTKYEVLSTTGQGNTQFTLSPGDYNAYPMYIDSIELNVSADINKIIITNTVSGRKIIINGEYTTGQVIKLSPDTGILTRNGQNIKNNLDYLESDWHGFSIYYGDQITVSPTMEITLNTRARLL